LRILGALKKYYEDFDSQKKKLEDLKVTFSNGTVEAGSLEVQVDSLRKSLDYSGEWAKRVGVLHDRLEDIAKNVPELKEEDVFRNMLGIVGMMMDKTKVINDEIKVVTDEIERFIDEHVCLNCDCYERESM